MNSSFKVQNLIRTSLKFSEMSRKRKGHLPGQLQKCPELSDVEILLRSIDVSSFDRNPEFQNLKSNKADFGYFDLFNDGYLVIMLMFLPSQSVYPFHDHPEMTVLSKLLEGQIGIWDCNLVSPVDFYNSLSNKTKPLSVSFKDVSFKHLKTGEVSLIKSGTSNVHSLIAEKDSVILDVLFNYYDASRRCSFFEPIEQQSETQLRAILIDNKD